MAAKLIHAVDTRYSPARKVRVPEEHLKIFPYLKARNPKGSEPKTAPAPKPVVEAPAKPTPNAKKEG